MNCSKTHFSVRITIYLFIYLFIWISKDKLTTHKNPNIKNVIFISYFAEDQF